jgi:hypothetical protein
MEHFFDFAEGYVPSTSATNGERRHQGLLERVKNSFFRRRRGGWRSGNFEHSHCDDIARASPPSLFVGGATSGRRLVRDFRGGRRWSAERAAAPPDHFGNVRFTSAVPPAPSPSPTPPLCVLLGLGATSAFVATDLLGERGLSCSGFTGQVDLPVGPFAGTQYASCVTDLPLRPATTPSIENGPHLLPLDPVGFCPGRTRIVTAH